MDAIERAFRAGWHQGGYDERTDHCFIPPTVDSAWEDFKRGHVVMVYDKAKRAFVPCVPKGE